MKVYTTPSIRNVALIGHGDCGKTSLAASLLHTGGTVGRLGSVDDGTAVTDFDDEEIERKISMHAALAPVEWNQKKINLIDTPGYAAFIADAKAGLAVADTALLLVEGVSGVQVMTRRTFGYAEELGLPLVFAVTKLDRERADFDRALSEIQDAFGREAVPIELPIGSEDSFRGTVDLVTMKARVYSGSGKAKTEDIPADVREAAEDAHGVLVEMIAESDEALMEAFFEAGDLDADQIVEGLRAAIRERKIFPVLAVAATREIGSSGVLDTIASLFPSPEERKIRGTDPGDGSEVERSVSDDEPTSLFVFKTVADPFAGRLSLFRVCGGTVRGDSNVHNMRLGKAERLGNLATAVGKELSSIETLHAGDLGVLAKLKDTLTNDTLADPQKPFAVHPISFPEATFSYAIEPKSKGDEEKISTALSRLTEEDAVLSVGRDPQTGEMLVRGSSQQHVEVAVAKMKRKYGVEATLKQPKVPYLETIRKKVGPIEGKHKKQSGGRGQFGVCVIEMEPLPRGKQFEFVDKIFGGAIPQNYRPAVEKGIQETAEKGVIAGYPVVDFRVTLLDGKYHNVDSSEMAFKIAGSLAFKDAVRQANPVLLEPVMDVEITAPEEYMGDIMGDLSSRRGKPQGMEAQGAYQIIKAQVPLSEMLTFDSALKSITSDTGSFHMEFAHYDPTPANVQQQIVAEAAKAAEDAH